MELLEACATFNVFKFEESEYEQCHGLAMGSPLSPVLAQLFMENLESGPIRKIVGPHITWLRYVDDTLVLIPRRKNPQQLLDQLNKIHPRITFTMEEEVDDVIPFLDTLIHREDSSVRLSVYRKPTNKDDYFHYFSGHDDSTKRGIVIGFYLRAMRICDEEFLEEEISHINTAFARLRHPPTFLKECLHKARFIHRRGTSKAKPELYVVVPSSDAAHALQRTLGKRVAIANKCGKRIMDVTRAKKKTQKNENSLVYEIPCEHCPKVYVGKTHLGLEKRLYEHKRDLARSEISNALVKH